jgi:hypothetical protein
MNRCVVLFVFASFALSTSALADAPEGPARDVPELQVLNHWAGTWDVDVTLKPDVGFPMGRHAMGTATAHWILNGRFLQQTGTMEAGLGQPATQVTTLMTYDPGKKVFRGWIFFSSGYTGESEGSWDEKSRTLTSTSRDAGSGITTTTRASFAEDGTENWTITSRDRDGKVLNEMTGKNTRRKK